MTARIGLLLPNSNIINRLAADIRGQVAEGFGGGGLPPAEFIVEATAYNASRDEVRARLQELLIKHDADLIIAPLNPGMIASVEDLARGQETPLFILTMGEDICEGDLAPP